MIDIQEFLRDVDFEEEINRSCLTCYYAEEQEGTEDLFCYRKSQDGIEEYVKPSHVCFTYRNR